MAHSFLQYDVFTGEPLTGNQLAVFPDGRGLATDLMQSITREMNFSETTFILPAEQPGTDVRMRIFTPGLELPMAGHPVIGSTFALADAGTIASGTPRFVFGLVDHGVFLFAILPAGSEATVYSRMFAPHSGVFEDPATGSASGPLGAYLVRHGVVSGAAALQIVSLQGVAMKRPSRIHIAIEGDADTIKSVKVGGEAVLVARGELLIPE